MITVKNLFYQHHGASVPLFQDLSFQLESQRLHALVGKNGSGKSTLLHILAGDVSPHAILQGAIEVPKKFLIDQRFDRLIADQFTFEENLKFAQIRWIPSPIAGLPQAGEVPDFLEHFQIDPTIPVAQLSGGQRQILALLMALQRQPQLLLLDEPTAALDEQNAEMVFEFLGELTETTQLVICHDIELLQRYTTGQTLRVGSPGSWTSSARNMSFNGSG